MTGLTEIAYGGPERPIDGYGPGFFRVGGIVFRGGLILSPQGAVPWPDPGDLAPLAALAGCADLLIHGTGARLSPADAGLVAAARAAGLALETMASPAAARTYNVLLAEGRRVAAALVPV